jgi:3-oxoacyl-[acyl-carrier protein] reductase
MLPRPTRRKLAPQATASTPWRVSATRAAAELGTTGITVNIVVPGPMQTGYLPAHFAGDLASKFPPGRIGQTEDVADAIVLLASEQARWIIGQKTYVDGGNTMCL